MSPADFYVHNVLNSVLDSKDPLKHQRLPTSGDKILGRMDYMGSVLIHNRENSVF